MIGRIELRYQGFVAELSRRQAAALRGPQQQALLEVGKTWQRDMVPEHFKVSGARLYGYTPRSGEQYPYGSREFRRSYTGRKKRMFGHTNPLVWSGRSRTLAQHGQIRATAKLCTVKVPAPALNFRNPRSKIDMRTEVLKVVESELKTLGAAASKRFERVTNRMTDTAREVV